MTDERLATLEQVAALHTEAISRATALIGELTASYTALGSVLAAVSAVLDPHDRERVRVVARAAAENTGGSATVLASIDGLTGEPADGAVALPMLRQALQ